MRPIIVPANDEQEALTAALYRGELTYGQYNVQSTALAANMRKRLAEGADAASREEASRREDSNRPAEIARREEALARASVPPPAPPTKAKTLEEDLYECKQEAARTFPPAMTQS